jgi:hypothetical protein
VYTPEAAVFAALVLQQIIICRHSLLLLDCQGNFHQKFTPMGRHHACSQGSRTSLMEPRVSQAASAQGTCDVRTYTTCRSHYASSCKQASPNGRVAQLASQREGEHISIFAGNPNLSMVKRVGNRAQLEWNFAVGVRRQILDVVKASEGFCNVLSLQSCNWDIHMCLQRDE